MLTGLLFYRSSPLYLAFGVIIGLLNYRSTERFRRVTGKSPWGIHPIVWGLASVLVSLFVTVLAFIAMSTSNRRRMQNGGAYGAGNGAGPQSNPFARYPSRPPQSPTRQPPGPHKFPQPQSSAPDPAISGQPVPATLSAPPGWQADPSGKYDFRYWDGDDWTEFVSQGGVTSSDPPVPRQGGA